MFQRSFVSEVDAAFNIHQYLKFILGLPGILVNYIFLLKFISNSSVCCFSSVLFPCFLLQNEKGQCPADVVSDPLDMPLDMADAAAVAKELRTLLREAIPKPSTPLPFTLHNPSPPALSDKARIQLAAMGIRLGDRVVIAGQKVCCRSLSKVKSN